MLLIYTVTPPSVVGKGNEPAAAVDAVKLVPNTEAIAAAVRLCVKLAPPTTPPLLTFGGVVPAWITVNGNVLLTLPRVETVTLSGPGVSPEGTKTVRDVALAL